MASSNQDFLGNGLTIPLRRLGATGFLSASGVALVRSCIRQIVGTRRGELRWRPQFGTLLEKHKHKPNNEALEELIKDEIKNALATFEPRLNKIDLSVNRDGSTIVVSITWNVIDKNIPGNQVLLGPDTFEVTI